jgi:predicted O-linked N-acetylglucosamine transferase (SPINDLY family)
VATISEAFSIAIRHHQAGRLQTAEQIYRQILAADPDQAQAWHLLGVIAHQTGRHQAAIDCIQHSIRLDGSDARAHSNLGEAFRALGKFPEAIACYQRALQWKPDAGEIHYNLGIALKAGGQLAEAIAAYRRAVQLKPDHYRAHNNLGNALREQRATAEAIASLRRAVELRPDFAEAYDNLGLALQDQGHVAEAIDCFRQTLKLKPGAAEAYVNLANALRSQGRPAEAIACLQQALDLKPDFAPAHYNLGFALQDQGQLGEAAASYRQALQLMPDYADAVNNLACVLGMEGRVNESLLCYRRAMELQPDNAAAHSAYLITLQHRPGVSLSELAEAHRAFDERHAAPLHATWKPHANSRDPERRLRLGVLSPLLWSNPAAQLLLRPLEGLGRQPCDLFCYSCRPIRDRSTDRMAAAVRGWHDVSAMSDDALAEQIRSDRIDILLDVAGHLAHHRLLALARKPAPVQITWLAYEGTTGMAAMDYILADRHVIPAGAEPYYRERVLRMPDGYVCYDPAAEAPAVGPLPALAEGRVTFASFSKPMKITADVVRVWAEILRQLPDARLMLKYRGFDCPAVQPYYGELFRAEGIDPGRVEFSGWSKLSQALEAYHRVDIALDPFPFSGSLTTCDALWMGVPVVTCPTETFAGRHSLTHLANLGLTELVAADFSDYVRRAVDLARDLPLLAALRAGLRQRMEASPLCDGPRFAENLMALLRTAWREWAENEGHGQGPANE